MQPTQMDTYVTLTFRIDPGEQDEGGYVSYCPELDIASQGDDLNEALQNIKDAALTFISGLVEMGLAAAYLRERGLVVRQDATLEPLTLAVSKGEVVSVLAALVGRNSVFA